MALYRDPADKRVFVPKKGGGVALVIVVGVTVAVLT
jgi:uncharacterized membrane protein